MTTRTAWRAVVTGTAVGALLVLGLCENSDLHEVLQRVAEPGKLNGRHERDHARDDEQGDPESRNVTCTTARQDQGTKDKMTLAVRQLGAPESRAWTLQLAV